MVVSQVRCKVDLGGAGSVKRIVRLAPGLLESQGRPRYDEVEWRFDLSPFLEQMPDLCSKFDLEFAEVGNEGDYYVLTAGPDPSSATLKTVADLISIDADEDTFHVLYVQKGASIVHQRLGKLEDALELYSSHAERVALQAVRAALIRFLGTIRGEIRLTEESIVNDAMRPVLQAATCSKEVAEQAMACLGELCQSLHGFEWLSDRPETLSSSFFEHIFQVLFPSPEDEAEMISKSGSQREHPWATLYTTCFLLHDCMDCAHAAHRAACKKVNGRSDLTIYGEMIESVESCDDFKATAAMGVLSSMVLACERVPELQPKMKQEFIRYGDAGSGKGLFKRCGTNETLVKGILAASMYHCSEASVVLKSVQETAAMKQTIRNLRRDIDKVSNEYLKMHKVMMKMLTCMKTDAHPFVQRSLPSIIKSGWDALQWQRGYNLLHYAAECVDDPDLVELIGLLSTDLDARDSNHMRPIDFARERKNEDIIDVIQRLRGERNGIVGEKGEQKVQRKNGQKLKEQFEQLEGLSAELRAEIEQVLDFGWDPSAWQGKISPVQRAAKCGHVEAIKFLAELGADLCSAESPKFTPVDAETALPRLWGRWRNAAGLQIVISRGGFEKVVIHHYSQGEQTMNVSEFIRDGKLHFFCHEGTLADSVITWSNGSTWTKDQDHGQESPCKGGPGVIDDHRAVEQSEHGCNLTLQDFLDVFHICKPERQLAVCVLLKLSTQQPQRCVEEAVKFLTASDEEQLVANTRENLSAIIPEWEYMIPRLQDFMSFLCQYADKWDFHESVDVSNPPLVTDAKQAEAALTQSEASMLRRLAFVRVPPKLLDRITIKAARDHVFATAPIVLPDAQPTAVVMIGPPGAGKSYCQQAATSELSEQHGTPPSEAYAHIDPDFWISSHCANDNRFRNVANFLNHETFLITVRERRNMVFDGTGRSLLNTCGRVIARLKQAKYRIFMCIVLSPITTCLKRISSRCEETGRAVPEEFVRSTFRSLQTVVPEYIRHHVDLAEGILIYVNTDTAKLQHKLLVDACDSAELEMALGCAAHMLQAD